MEQDAQQINAGLCERCVYSRKIESLRGSTFYLCELSETDPRFPKYPRIPVLACDGFKEMDPTKQLPTQ